MRKEKMKSDQTDPLDLIKGLWYGASRVTLTTRQYRAIRSACPTDHLLLRNGAGYVLKHKAVGAGLYEVWLEPR